MFQAKGFESLYFSSSGNSMKGTDLKYTSVELIGIVDQLDLRMKKMKEAYETKISSLGD